MPETKLRIDVSPEMAAFVGAGAVPAGRWPEDSVLVSFWSGEGEVAPVLRFDPQPTPQSIESAEVVLLVRREACKRLFGGIPAARGSWYLPTSLRALSLSIRDCEADLAVRPTLQGARSVELLCQAFAEIGKGELVPAEGGGVVSQIDAARIAAARRLIDERWQEKLTLEGIARACGLNRDKLSRGFRAIYNSTVADVLTEKRLEGARRLLLASDLPVAVVGYRCGYLNNASFTRAFSRRFGTAPTQLRQARIAA